MVYVQKLYWLACFVICQLSHQAFAEDLIDHFPKLEIDIVKLNGTGVKDEYIYKSYVKVKNEYIDTKSRRKGYFVYISEITSNGKTRHLISSGFKDEDEIIDLSEYLDKKYRVVLKEVSIKELIKKIEKYSKTANLHKAL